MNILDLGIERAIFDYMGMNCCMCGIVAGGRRHGVIDEPFMESDGYIAIASVGSFIDYKLLE